MKQIISAVVAFSLTPLLVAAPVMETQGNKVIIN